MNLWYVYVTCEGAYWHSAAMTEYQARFFADMLLSLTHAWHYDHWYVQAVGFTSEGERLAYTP